MNVTSSPELEKLKELTEVAQPKISLTEAIAKSVTARVLESLSTPPQSESTPELESVPDVDEEANLDAQVDALNEIDAVVLSKLPITISAPKDSLHLPQAVVLSSEDVMLLRAALRANVMHVVIKVLSLALEK